MDRMNHAIFAVREARAEDGEAVSRIYAPYVRETAISFEEAPPDGAEMARRIEETLGAYPYLVAEAGGAVCGYAYASAHRTRAAYRWSADVTVYLDKDHRGRGIGRALYGALLPILTRQGIVTAYAGITLPNPASVALHEAIGFTPIAVYRSVGFKLGAWRDVGWWEKRLRAPEAIPAEIVPWPKLPRA